MPQARHKFLKHDYDMIWDTNFRIAIWDWINKSYGIKQSEKRDIEEVEEVEILYRVDHTENTQKDQIENLEVVLGPSLESNLPKSKAEKQSNVPRDQPQPKKQKQKKKGFSNNWSHGLVVRNKILFFLFSEFLFIFCNMF